MTSFKWQGREDEPHGLLTQRWHQTIANTQVDGAANILLGFPCDLGVINNGGRAGAKMGPDAIRRALCNLAWHAPTTIADAGDSACHDDLVAAQQLFADKLSEHLRAHQFVIGLGGGHEIAWASYQGLMKTGVENLGIINIDAHFDLRQPAPLTSSGTPFYQIAQDCKKRDARFQYTCLGVADAANTALLFDYAKRSGTRYLNDVNCSFDNMCDTVTPMLDTCESLYLSICLDAFSASAAPGVSAPSALGVEIHTVVRFIHWLSVQAKQRKISWLIADIAEMNPKFDVDERTAKLAARLIFEIIHAQYRV